jgi:NADPH:quinone reductase-like Zn-dependent oxidoreductase
MFPLVFSSSISLNHPMRAVQLVAHGKPGTFRLADLPKPKPGPDEVLVQVKACGLNRLDLWAEEAGLPIKLELPRTLGGEVAGVIAELGEDVDQWRLAERVTIQSNLFCGFCEYCLKGEESLCLHGELLGVGRDGGFAEFVKVPARSVVRIPEAVDFTGSAALTLAGSTAMHMLTNRAEVRSSEWVLVIAGASGVGTYAIQIAKQLGAQVISTGSSEAKRTFIKTLGADFALDSTDENWPKQVREITQKRGVDLIVEHVGGDVFEKCFHCLGRGGVIVTCGATAGREVKINLWPLFAKQQCVIGSYGRNRADIEATLEWAGLGRIRPVIHQTFPLERTAEAFKALRDRAVLGKIVINP